MRGASRLYAIIPAGGEKSFSVDGDTFYLASAGGPITIETGDTPAIPIAPGTGIRFRAATFDRLTIRDTSGAANEVVILAGAFDVIGGGGGGGSTFDGILSVSLPSSPVVTPLQVSTSAAGATWVPFTASPCSRLEIVNTSSGVDIEYTRGGAGVAITIPAYTSRMILGVTDASQISVRRVDVSNTQVSVKAESFQ